MFALNSLELLDDNQLIYRALKNSGFQIIVFIDYSDGNYKYITYDRESFFLVHFPSHYKPKINRTDFISKMEELKQKLIPPEKGMFARDQVSINENYFPNKIKPFFYDSKYQKIKFALVINTDIFCTETPHKGFSDLINHFRKASTISCKTIVFKIYDVESYKAFATSVRNDKKVEDPNINVEEYAEEKALIEGHRFVKIKDAQNDEIRNLLLRYKLLEPENFDYSPSDAELLVEEIKKDEYFTDKFNKVPSIYALNNIYNEENALINKLNELKKYIPDRSEVNYSDNKKKAALDIKRLTLNQYEQLTPEDAKKKLNEMIGIDNIKEKLNGFMDSIKELGKSAEDPGHFIFSGNPGTGKTEVALLMGALFKGIGLLPKGHLVKVRTTDLVSSYVGDTRGKTRAQCIKALGGVLFIDEAYELTSKKDGQAGYEQEAYNELMGFLDDNDNRGKISVIFAGYPREMEIFLEGNPGMRGKIGGPDRIISFPNFEPSELFDILKQMAGNRKFNLDPSYNEKAKEVFNYWYNSGDKNFGNARFVRNMIESSTKKYASRLRK